MGHSPWGHKELDTTEKRSPPGHQLISGRTEFWAYFLVADLSLSNYHSRPKNVYIYKGSAGTSPHYSLSL